MRGPKIKPATRLQLVLALSGVLALGTTPRLVAQTLTILHSFTTRDNVAGTNSDGAQPFGSMTVSGGTLWGQARFGGIFGKGAVVGLNPDATKFTNLHSFNGTDGMWPGGGLISSGNVVCGTTDVGGP